MKTTDLFVEQVIAGFDAFRGECALADDVTLVALEVGASERAVPASPGTP